MRYKLTSPKVFRHIYNHGPEQLIFFTGTLIITLFTDLMFGIFGGLGLVLLVHWLLTMVPIREFFKMIFDSGSHIFINKDGSYNMQIKGIANFLATLKVENLMSRIQPGSKVTVDLSAAKLVDFSILENLYDFQRTHTDTGGSVKITGLENHNSSCSDKRALKILPNKFKVKLTRRQIHLAEISEDHNWDFNPEPVNNLESLESCFFF